MTDAVRLELEQYYDGELASDRRAEVRQGLVEDAEARSYLAQLARLRRLAHSSERAVDRNLSPAGRRAPSRLRTARVWIAATAALAASVAAMLVWRSQFAHPTPIAPNAGTTAAVNPSNLAPGHRAIANHGAARHPVLEQGPRRPEPAGRTILLSRTRLGKRLAAVEMMALELANSTSELARDVEPLGLLHKRAPGGRGRFERHPRHPRLGTPRT